MSQDPYQIFIAKLKDSNLIQLFAKISKARNDKIDALIKEFKGLSDKFNDDIERFFDENTSSKEESERFQEDFWEDTYDEIMQELGYDHDIFKHSI